MSVLASEEEYEEDIKRLLDTAYTFCDMEMCEKGDKISFPAIKFVPGLTTPRYRGHLKLIEFPTLENKRYNLFIEYEKAAHEMAHHFQNTLSNYPKNESLELEQITADGKREKIKVEDFVKKLKPEEKEEIVRQIDKLMNEEGRKNKDKIQKWKEGTAYRVQEKFLSRMLKRCPFDAEFAKMRDNAPRIQSPEKHILKDLMPEPSIKFLKHQTERGLNLDDHTYENPSIITKIKAVTDEFRYLKNSRQGWLKLRKLPELEFKKLLKDKEAHNKIDWSSK